jgi:hypothetical protein
MKSVFQVHGVDATGQVVDRRRDEKSANGILLPTLVTPITKRSI